MENNGIMKYRCKSCNLDYATYNGLWKHNKNYHNTVVTICNHKGHNNVTIPPSSDKLTNNCKFCNKLLSSRQGKWRHENTCKQKTVLEDNNKIKEQLVTLTKDIEVLKNKCNKKKITNNNNNNGIINNITINKTGTEKLSELTKNEITKIFNKELESIFTFVEMINFNERLKTNHSFCTTNLESKFLSTYNDETKTIDKERKKYFFDKLLDSSIERIEILYKSNRNIFNSKKQKQIEDNITNIKDLKNYTFENKIFKEITNKFNLLTYNKRKLIQETWKDEPDSDGETFEDDLNKVEDKETSPEYLEFKKKYEKSNILKYNFTDSSDDEASDESSD